MSSRASRSDFGLSDTLTTNGAVCVCCFSGACVARAALQTIERVSVMKRVASELADKICHLSRARDTLKVGSSLERGQVCAMVANVDSQPGDKSSG